ncbi:MAG TPA: 3-deoxy-D-manno-octulosonic acid transferase [Methylomirabilota bacterium]|nr:3-deoxy-D-manno-octulosonic acid transferase [Methylomirabilota bacterium]
MPYILYNCFSTLLFIIGLPFLPLLLLLGDRFRNGLLERFAYYSRALSGAIGGSRPIWIHAASVGEVSAASELAREFKGRLPGKKIIISTFTDTGNRIARGITAADSVLFLPLDQLWVVRRALRKLDPSILIVLETEIWPNLLREAYRKGVPTLLLSGRLSVRSFERYSLFRVFFRQVMECFSAMGMQSEEDARRIVSLGADVNRVSVVGNLKRASSARRGIDDAKAEKEEAAVGRQNQLLVIGSSHRGEEEILIGVYLSLKKRFPRLQMVLAPRHPQRFSEVEKLLQARGLDYEKKSRVNGRVAFANEVMLLDTVGDLQDFYAMGDIAFVGGSLVDAGGHNLLEPARCRKPVLFGPYMSNFASLALEMKQRGAGIEVVGAEDLTRELADLLGDPERCRTVGEKAYGVATGDHGVMQRSLALAQKYLPSDSLH